MTLSVILWFTFYSVGGEESQISGFQGVLVGEVGGAGLGFRFSGQGGVVHLESMRGHYTDISRYTISEFYFDDISDNELLGVNGQFLSITHDQSELKREDSQVMNQFHEILKFKSINYITYRIFHILLHIRKSY